MYEKRIVRGDVFKTDNDAHVIITNSKKDNLAGKKFNFEKPYDHHYDPNEISLRREDIIEKITHLPIGGWR